MCTLHIHRDVYCMSYMGWSYSYGFHFIFVIVVTFFLLLRFVRIFFPLLSLLLFIDNLRKILLCFASVLLARLLLSWTQHIQLMVLNFIISQTKIIFIAAILFFVVFFFLFISTFTFKYEYWQKLSHPIYRQI